jgi:hypothetical protein
VAFSLMAFSPMASRRVDIRQVAASMERLDLIQSTCVKGFVLEDLDRFNG